MTTPDDCIRLTSWNICSLGDPKKRKNIYNKINRSQSNIFLLLDTRTSKEAEWDCQKNSPHQIFFNSYASNARGVAIEIKDSCPIQDVKATIIVPGNLTKLNFTYKDEKFALAALYAPNNKDIPFVQKLFEMETDPDVEHTLYSGDWNSSLSQQMDTHGYLHENNTHNCDFVKRKMVEYELNDVWRTRNPFETNFTFMKKQTNNT